MFTLAPAWGTCQDIGGNHAGVVSAAMNTSGQIGSILSPLMVTFLLARTRRLERAAAGDGRPVPDRRRRLELRRPAKARVRTLTRVTRVSCSSRRATNSADSSELFCPRRATNGADSSELFRPRRATWAPSRANCLPSPGYEARTRANCLPSPGYLGAESSELFALVGLRMARTRANCLPSPGYLGADVERIVCPRRATWAPSRANCLPSPGYLGAESSELFALAPRSSAGRGKGRGDCGGRPLPLDCK